MTQRPSVYLQPYGVIMADTAFQCPSCGARLRASDALVARGANITCPRCATVLSLAGLNAPAASQPATPPPEPEADELEVKPKKKKRPRPLRRSSSGSGAGTIALFVVLGVVLVGGLVGLGIWLLPGIGKSAHEKVIEDMVTSLERLADSIDRVKDRATAEAEVPNIRANMNRMADAFEALKKLDKPSASVDADLKKRYEPRMQAAAQRMQGMMRLAGNREAMAVLAPVFLEIGPRMQELTRGAGGMGPFGMPR